MACGSRALPLIFPFHVTAACGFGLNLGLFVEQVAGPPRALERNRLRSSFGSFPIKWTH